MWMRFVWVLVLLTAPLTVRGATILGLAEPELVKRVEVIAFGAVVRTEVEVHPDFGVYTRARFEVYEGLSGSAKGDVVTVLVPGGNLPGGLRSRVAGAPSPKPGDRVVAFLEKRGDHYVPWGLSYGWLPVRKDVRGQLRVSRSLKGLSPMGSNGDSVEKHTLVFRDVPLQAYMARVRGYVERGGSAVEPSSEEGSVR